MQGAWNVHQTDAAGDAAGKRKRVLHGYVVRSKADDAVKQGVIAFGSQVNFSVAKFNFLDALGHKRGLVCFLNEWRTAGISLIWF